MCLTNITTKNHLIAETDIKCYKVIKKIDNDFFTPFMSSYIELGETYYSKLKYPNLYNSIYRFTLFPYSSRSNIAKTKLK
jgi:hypothetical protein